MASKRPFFGGSKIAPKKGMKSKQTPIFPKLCRVFFSKFHPHLVHKVSPSPSFWQGTSFQFPRDGPQPKRSLQKFPIVTGTPPSEESCSYSQTPLQNLLGRFPRASNSENEHLDLCRLADIQIPQKITHRNHTVTGKLGPGRTHTQKYSSHSASSGNPTLFSHSMSFWEQQALHLQVNTFYVSAFVIGSHLATALPRSCVDPSIRTAELASTWHCMAHVWLVQERGGGVEACLGLPKRQQFPIKPHSKVLLPSVTHDSFLFVSKQPLEMLV